MRLLFCEAFIAYTTLAESKAELYYNSGLPINKAIEKGREDADKMYGTPKQISSLPWSNVQGVPTLVDRYLAQGCRPVQISISDADKQIVDCELQNWYFVGVGFPCSNLATVTIAIDNQLPKPHSK